MRSRTRVSQIVFGAVFGVLLATVPNCSASSLDVGLEVGCAVYGASTVTQYEATTGPFTKACGGSGIFSTPSVANSTVLYSYSGTTTANYGLLQASISLGELGQQNPAIETFYALSSFRDNLTFNAGSVSGGYAYLHFSIHGTGTGPALSVFHLEGAISNEGVGFYSGDLSIQPFTSHSFDATNLTVNTSVTSDPIPFVSGSPVTVIATLDATVLLNCYSGINLAACLTWAASATSDFQDTVVLDGIDLFDTNGVPIDGFTIESQSGTDYTSAGITVPEPSSAFLMIIAFGGAAMAMRKRREIFDIQRGLFQLRNI